jgi:hypothetical protein
MLNFGICEVFSAPAGNEFPACYNPSGQEIFP